MDGPQGLLIFAVVFVIGWLLGRRWRTKTTEVAFGEGSEYVSYTERREEAAPFLREHLWGRWTQTDENSDASLIRECQTCGMVQCYWGPEDEDDDYEIESVPDCFQPAEGSDDSGRSAGDSAA